MHVDTSRLCLVFPAVAASLADCVGGAAPVQARLSRFQDASAISSADFYGGAEGGGGGGPARSGSDFDITASDLVNKLSFQASLLGRWDGPTTATVSLACAPVLPPSFPGLWCIQTSIAPCHGPTLKERHPLLQGCCQGRCCRTQPSTFAALHSHTNGWCRADDRLQWRA